MRHAVEELEALEIPWRYSFFDDSEVGGLFWGLEDELADGACKFCGKEIEHEGLFCSSVCEARYAQLRELRREESEQEIKCILCGRALDLWSKNTIKHHVSYIPEKTVYVCRSCHRRIHSHHLEYPDLAPKKPPDWKSREVYEPMLNSMQFKPHNEKEVPKEDSK